MPKLDKRALIADLRRLLDDEIAQMTRIAIEAAQAASHEENKPEGDKDMRSTEASYIARGQASRARDLERESALLAALRDAELTAPSKVVAPALVELEVGKSRDMVLLLPSGGGRRLTQAGVVVRTVTPQSPLGAALLGLSVGDEVEVPTPQGLKTYEIISID